MCRPKLIESDRPIMNLKQMRHPCLCDNFIPNDVVLEDRSVMLLTGPNMGGKSTTLRMTCYAAILA